MNETSSSGTPAPPRVIVADDHPVVVRGLVTLLRSAGFDVVAEGRDGADALALLRKEKPALAILDVGMPVMNGIAVLRAARAEHLATAFVMLSLHDDKAIADAAIELGARAYVVKDNAETEIVEAARAALAGRVWRSAKIAERAGADGLDLLSAAELRVLALLAQNLTSPQIAEKLSLSTRTVQNHRAHICEKLGLTGSHRLLQLALEQRERIEALLSAAAVAER